MCCGGSEGGDVRHTRTVSPQSAPPPPPPGTQINIVFTGIGDCVVTGSHSSKDYFFTSDHPEHSIDFEDAPALLNSGFFRLTIHPC